MDMLKAVAEAKARTIRADEALRVAQIEATIAADAYNKIVVSMSDHVQSLAESILEEGANQ